MMAYGVRALGNRWSDGNLRIDRGRGAPEDDLRDASLDIPQRQLSVATGVSGQGTSSTG
jgi:excinuclease UvrABC ATPase subunit